MLQKQDKCTYSAISKKLFFKSSQQTLFATLLEVKCFSRGAEGHLIRACLKQKPDYRTLSAVDAGQELTEPNELQNRTAQF